MNADFDIDSQAILHGLVYLDRHNHLPPEGLEYSHQEDSKKTKPLSPKLTWEKIKELSENDSHKYANSAEASQNFEPIQTVEELPDSELIAESAADILDNKTANNNTHKPSTSQQASKFELEIDSNDSQHSIATLKIETSLVMKELARFRACDDEGTCFYCREWAQWVYRKHFIANNSSFSSGSGGGNKKKKKQHTSKADNSSTTNKDTSDEKDSKKGSKDKVKRVRNLCNNLKMLISEVENKNKNFTNSSESTEIPSASQKLVAPSKTKPSEKKVGLPNPTTNLVENTNKNKNSANVDSENLIENIVDAVEKFISGFEFPYIDNYEELTFEFPIDAFPFDENHDSLDPALLLPNLTVTKTFITLPSSCFALLGNITSELISTHTYPACQHNKAEHPTPSELETARVIFNSQLLKYRKEYSSNYEREMDPVWQITQLLLKSVQRIEAMRVRLFTKGCHTNRQQFIQSIKDKTLPFTEYWAQSANLINDSSLSPENIVEELDRLFSSHLDNILDVSMSWSKTFLESYYGVAREFVRELETILGECITMCDRRALGLKYPPPLNLRPQLEAARNTISQLQPCLSSRIEKIQTILKQRNETILDEVLEAQKIWKFDQNLPPKQAISTRLEVANKKELKKKMKRIEFLQHTEVISWSMYEMERLLTSTDVANVAVDCLELLVTEARILERAVGQVFSRKLHSTTHELCEQRQEIIDDFTEGLLTGREELAGIIGKLLLKEAWRILEANISLQRQNDLLGSKPKKGKGNSNNSGRNIALIADSRSISKNTTTDPSISNISNIKLKLQIEPNQEELGNNSSDICLNSEIQLANLDNNDLKANENKVIISDNSLNKSNGNQADSKDIIDNSANQNSTVNCNTLNKDGLDSKKSFNIESEYSSHLEINKASNDTKILSNAECSDKKDNQITSTTTTNIDKSCNMDLQKDNKKLDHIKDECKGNSIDNNKILKGDTKSNNTNIDIPVDIKIKNDCKKSAKSKNIDQNETKGVNISTNKNTIKEVELTTNKNQNIDAITQNSESYLKEDNACKSNLNEQVKIENVSLKALAKSPIKDSGLITQKNKTDSNDCIQQESQNPYNISSSKNNLSIIDINTLTLQKIKQLPNEELVQVASELFNQKHNFFLSMQNTHVQLKSLIEAYQIVSNEANAYVLQSKERYNELILVSKRLIQAELELNKWKLAYEQLVSKHSISKAEPPNLQNFDANTIETQKIPSEHGHSKAISSDDTLSKTQTASNSTNITKENIDQQFKNNATANKNTSTIEQLTNDINNIGFNSDTLGKINKNLPANPLGPNSNSSLLNSNISNFEQEIYPDVYPKISSNFYNNFGDNLNINAPSIKSPIQNSINAHSTAGPAIPNSKLAELANNSYNNMFGIQGNHIRNIGMPTLNSDQMQNQNNQQQYLGGYSYSLPWNPYIGNSNAANMSSLMPVHPQFNQNNQFPFIQQNLLSQQNGLNFPNPTHFSNPEKIQNKSVLGLDQPQPNEFYGINDNYSDKLLKNNAFSQNQLLENIKANGGKFTNPVSRNISYIADHVLHNNLPEVSSDLLAPNNNLLAKDVEQTSNQPEKVNSSLAT
ncbi:hypothetical protein BB561_001673 [Smittium simulii]|uniref:Uncharacterized protein n=1 Tax=Smittium simulii TaxID=133385 RepID=A0A2T9YTI6_9FUNG|nr:hypothetical protein BB561_001673 [Smittium simulii]